MEYIVYILSDDRGKLYKGMTCNLVRRLREHRSGHTKSTSGMKNIQIVYIEKYDNLKDARNREKYLKTAAGRRFVKFKIIRP